MTGSRRLLALIAVALPVAAAAIILALSPRQPPTSAKVRPKLLLLTSLPLVFSEDFSLEGGGSPALNALNRSYRVVAISVTSPSELGKGDLLLMAQPQAQTAENLVALDEWVRRGGRVLLLADPMLEWPSNRPLGDVTRAPPMFADTGLLAHWGLRLDAPEGRGASVRQLGSFRVVTVSPGHLTGACRVRDGGLDAECRVGRGRAFVVADADFLDAPALGAGAEHNLDALLEQLAKLSRS